MGLSTHKGVVERLPKWCRMSTLIFVVRDCFEGWEIVPRKSHGVANFGLGHLAVGFVFSLVLGGIF